MGLEYRPSDSTVLALNSNNALPLPFTSKMEADGFKVNKTKALLWLPDWEHTWTLHIYKITDAQMQGIREERIPGMREHFKEQVT